MNFNNIYYTNILLRHSLIFACQLFICNIFKGYEFKKSRSVYNDCDWPTDC